MKIQRKQSAINSKLLMLSLVYLIGNNFDADVGTALSKLGHGEAALQAMFANKMKGR
jgi:hypothetical protein